MKAVTFHSIQWSHVGHNVPTIPTAIPAIHLLSGIPPIKALLDMRILVAQSWHTLCTSGSLLPNSWPWKIRLPMAFDIFSNPPAKGWWKHQVREAVHEIWASELRCEAHEKSMLKHLNADTCNMDQIYPVWWNLSSRLDIRRATAKMLLLAQLYSRATSPTAGANKADTCPLCKAERETTVHFLLHCPVLPQTRIQRMHHILYTCCNSQLLGGSKYAYQN